MKVDYDRVAQSYDTHRRGGGPYLAKLVALAREGKARTVLEIGTGTGNNTHAFLAQYPCRLLGLDPSRGMLAQAKAKRIPARWVQGAAPHLPLAAACTKFVFGVYVLHHLADLDATLRECARVLDGGTAAFVTAPTDFIERHPMNRYFPSFAKVDTARFQPVDAVAAAFARAGFCEPRWERFTDAARPIDRDYVRKVAGKFISTYDLIPHDEYAAGLARLTADVDKRGRLDTEVVWESVVIWASQARS